MIIRSSKGDKDRTTVFPEKIKQELYRQLENVKKIHEDDCSLGYGEVYLPGALEKKYPEAPREWGWQWVFPSHKDKR